MDEAKRLAINLVGANGLCKRSSSDGDRSYELAVVV